mmetsp:Transcript_132577/g.383217  ORF Transcript_132577/g.383217 Transcript_132577/m.383217 type:complete len:265 (+) Transcript_132577:1083-1877(+)
MVPTICRRPFELTRPLLPTVRATPSAACVSERREEPLRPSLGGRTRACPGGVVTTFARADNGDSKAPGDPTDPTLLSTSSAGDSAEALLLSTPVGGTRPATGVTSCSAPAPSTTGAATSTGASSKGGGAMHPPAPANGATQQRRCVTWSRATKPPSSGVAHTCNGAATFTGALPGSAHPVAALAGGHTACARGAAAAAKTLASFSGLPRRHRGRNTTSFPQFCGSPPDATTSRAPQATAVIACKGSTMAWRGCWRTPDQPRARP